MIFEFLAASILAVTKAPLPVATAPANLRQKTEAALRLATVAKLGGPISSVGTTSLVIDGTMVNIVSNTVLLRRFGGKSTLSEFGAGNQVQVIGKWTDDTKTAINARVIHNLTIQKRNATFVGTIKSLSATGFVFEPLSRPEQTVTVSSTTRYIDRREKPITFSALAVGHKIKVKGLWDNKLNTLTSVVGVKDYSLPVIATPAGQLKETKTLPQQSGL